MYKMKVGKIENYHEVYYGHLEVIWREVLSKPDKLINSLEPQPLLKNDMERNLQE